MADIRRRIMRNAAAKPRPKLMRGADGRLRPVVPGGTDSDVADMWAEQRRIRLHEAIADSKHKQQKAERRKQFIKRLKPAKTHTSAKPKALVMQFSLPTVRLGRTVTKWGRRIAKKRLGQGAAVLGVGILLFFFVPVVFGHDKKDVQIARQKQPAAQTGVLNSQTQQPDYNTLLPEGKTIAQLGGWGRVSPPGKDPVYAFSDTVGGVHVTVSQQPLPDSFKADVAASTAQLAQQYSATEKLAVNGTTAYLGTSSKGPQSVILAEYGLLILMKSDTKLTNQQWVGYIYTLQQGN